MPSDLESAEKYLKKEDISFHFQDEPRGLEKEREIRRAVQFED